LKQSKERKRKGTERKWDLSRILDASTFQIIGEYRGSFGFFSWNLGKDSREGRREEFSWM